MGMKESGGEVASFSRGVCSVSEVAQAVNGRDWSGRQKRGEREVSNLPAPLPLLLPTRNPRDSEEIRISRIEPFCEGAQSGGLATGNLVFGRLGGM